MIYVGRPDAPVALLEHAEEWQRQYKEAIDKLAETPGSLPLRKHKKKVESQYNHPQIRQRLKDMFSSKCAYCESRIDHVAYSHIEHFRPKSIFPERCFSWDNLILACPRCNREKSDRFPTEEQNGPLVNPTQEEPDAFFLFEYDDQTGTANVVANENYARASVTVETIGLNRPELVKRRSLFVRNLVFIACKASEGDPQAMELLRLSTAGESEYAAFARGIIRRLERDTHP